MCGAVEELSDTVQDRDYDADHVLIKEEVLPGGRKKVILKKKAEAELWKES